MARRTKFIENVPVRDVNRLFFAWWWCCLPDPFRGLGAWRNSTETQQSGYAPRSERVFSLKKCGCQLSTFEDPPVRGMDNPPPENAFYGQPLKIAKFWGAPAPAML